MELVDTLPDCVEACRTCGVYFLTTSNFLRQLCTQPAENSEMTRIKMELAAWNIEVDENDGLPQHICTGCIHEFQKIFKFRSCCRDMQQQFRHFCTMRENNKVQIKIEQPDLKKDQTVCDFIYVDDLSDNDEYDATPFNFDHVAIKDEFIEAANVPVVNTSVVNSDNTTYVIKELQESDGRKHNSTRSVEDRAFESNTAANSINNRDSRVPCNMCSHLSHSHEQHQEHVKNIHSVRDLDCHICGKTFKNSTRARLKFHMKWHKLNKHVKCLECGFYCASKDTLRQHIRAVHSKSNCTICGEVVAAKRMQFHLRLHRNTLEWPCSYCNTIFSSERAHTKHIWQVHTREESKDNSSTFNSPTEFHCDQVFQSQNDLQQHVLEALSFDDATEDNVKLHTKSEMHINGGKLDETSSTESSVTNMQNYSSLEAESEILESHRFICAVCSDIFDTVEALCEHHRNHTKKPEFKCHICEKTFDLKFSLNRHLKKHAL